MQLAVWSGPRNMSTALMYSFAQRDDFCAIDEPFYAAYLKLTGLNHPMRDDIMSAQPTDPHDIIETLTRQKGTSDRHMYQKHMTQHMVPDIPRNWIRNVINGFLIRHPVRVVASFAKKYENPRPLDIGFERQVELFKYLVEVGETPIVVNSHDILQAPERTLKALCQALNIGFSPKMLSWSKGGMSCDGVWATHWYGGVHNSTGFSGPEGPLPELTGDLRDLADKAMPTYEYMLKYSI